MSELIRIWRSPHHGAVPLSSVTGTVPAEAELPTDSCSDRELKEIAASGFNAIWLEANLNHLVATAVFPELGTAAAAQQQQIRALIERAGRFGLQVYLGCRPLRALDRRDPFWERYPLAAGQTETIVGEDGVDLETQALCTSSLPVKRYLVQAGAELAQRLPGLGGVILITASEYPTHCWSRRGRLTHSGSDAEISRITCPRCARRNPAKVIAEIIRLLHHGIRSVSPQLKIVAWNRDWQHCTPAPGTGIIGELPRDVILMLDFERGGRKLIARRERLIDDCSLTFVGPSMAFLDSLEVAARCGLDIFARLQIGATRELATVPNLPLVANLFDKAALIRRLLLSGYMGCENFGNLLSVNTAAFNAFLSGDLPEKRDPALRVFAAEYFPECDAEGVAAAWTAFGQALDHYPYGAAFLDAGPINFAFILPTCPGPLSGRPLGSPWRPDERGDDMTAALGEYRIEEIIAAFDRLLERWQPAERLFISAVATSSHPHAAEEIFTARVCGHAFRSAANFCRVYYLRRQWDDALLPEYRAVIADELVNLREVLPLLQRDPRFGLHLESGAALYDADGVRRRIDELTRQLQG